MFNHSIIKIELEGMKFSLQKAISEKNDIFNEMIKKSLDNFCTEDHLESLVDDKVRKAVSSAMSESIDSYFRYGDGKAAIDEIVQERLKNEVRKIIGQPK